jgi:two-component system sensor histidine kinase UhpB
MRASFVLALLLVGQAVTIVGLIMSRRRLQETRARLTQLSQHLLRVQDRERAKLATTLEQTLIEDLTLLTLDLDRYLKRVAPPGQESFADRTRRLVARTEGLARELEPGSWQLDHFPDAITAAAAELTNRSGVHFLVEDAGFPSIASQATRMTLFRIIHAAMLNLAQHAGASQALVRLERENDRAIITLRDDGVGFDPKHPSPPALGLAGMRERAASIGAALRFDSRPLAGTRVTLALPLTSELP